MIDQSSKFVGNCGLYSLKLIYSRVLIDGVPQAPPLITSVKPRLNILTNLGVSFYRTISEECALTYQNDAKND